MQGENIVVAFITAIGTYLVTQAKVKHEVKGKTLESNTTTEGMYIESMELILTEYKEQVASFRDEVQELRLDNKELKSEFEDFRKRHKTEVEKYEVWVVELQEQNEDLVEENTGLKELVKELEGIK